MLLALVLTLAMSLQPFVLFSWQELCLSLPLSLFLDLIWSAAEVCFLLIGIWADSLSRLCRAAQMQKLWSTQFASHYWMFFKTFGLFYTSMSEEQYPDIKHLQMPLKIRKNCNLLLFIGEIFLSFVHIKTWKVSKSCHLWKVTDKVHMKSICRL